MIIDWILNKEKTKIYKYRHLPMGYPLKLRASSKEKADKLAARFGDHIVYVGEE